MCLKHPVVRKSEIGRILHLKSKNRDLGLHRLATCDDEVNASWLYFARVCPMGYFGFRI